MEPSQCRCCLSNLTPGLARDLYATYVWLDHKEVYSDMLRECFNIALSTAASSAICEPCVSQLRTAAGFRQQVLQAEENLAAKLQAHASGKNSALTREVKLEPVEADDEDNDFLSEAGRMILEPAKKEVIVVQRRKRPLKCKEGRSEKMRPLVKCLATPISGKNSALTREVKLEPVEADDEDNDFLSEAGRMILEPAKKEVIVVQRRKRPLKCKEGRSEKMRPLVKCLATCINTTEPPKSPLKKKQAQMKGELPDKEPLDNKLTTDAKQDKLKHKENLETILNYSNAMLFKKKTLLGFVCAYCDAPFPDPADLRTHTETNHKKERSFFKSNFDVTEYNVKLDVSNLACSLCDEEMDNLTILKQHLVKVHHKRIHNLTKDHLLQFKLKKGDVYDCALCLNTYETFKTLKQHMNKHYANYSCNKCFNTFPTRRSLRVHTATHQNGSFKCQYCDKVFSCKIKRRRHEKISHTGNRIISNCPHCNEPFRSYYQRNQHLIKVHNGQAPYKCKVCGKGFLLKAILMFHIKRTHLMERDVQCTECSSTFFSKKAMRAHMVKHSGEKNYSCEVCHKCYARKRTLQAHMRIHNNDRRFKCKVCAMTFVQKSSLQNHLVSNHDISMAACDITSS